MKVKKDIDFIIVGTGPGGATVAKELSKGFYQLTDIQNGSL